MDGARRRLAALITACREASRMLESKPTPQEISVENVKFLRNAEVENRYDETFIGLNGAMAGRF